MCRSSLLIAVNMAVTYGHTQEKMLTEINAIIDNEKRIKKSTPKYVLYGYRQYSEALIDVLVKPKIVFLYKVNGQFYKTNHSKLELPVWDVLPREQWDSLGNYGGMYWSNTFMPYFVG